MKPPHLCLLVAAGGLLFGPRQLLAQDKPADPKPPAEATKPASSADGKAEQPRREGDHREGEHGRRHHEGDRHGPELKPTPFIGVMTRSLSPEVRAQTGLQEGFGLLVEEVLPDSPAKTAGIQQHDVLVMLGDQRLVNMEQLAVLVHSSARDSEVVFTLKRAGAEQKVTVKVGEKMLPAMPPHGFRWPGPHPYGGMFEGGDGGEQMQRFGQDLREKAERFQRGMREFQGRMQDWSRGPRDHAAPEEPRYEQHERGQGEHRGGHDSPNPNSRPDKDGPQPPPQGGPVPKPQSSAEAGATANGAGSVAVSTSNSFERNVTRRDRSGEYSLRQEAAGKIFTVKPANGEEQIFSVTTAEQRKAVPEAFRAKLQELEEVSGQVKAQATDEAAPAEAEVRTTTI